MLLDLDKSILGDMGIRVMGDVIGILKQAKKVNGRPNSSRLGWSSMMLSRQESHGTVYATFRPLGLHQVEHT